uniref:Uncharacterized protein n=1 Tax=Photinus pyralis TaxID=7054 RepID=A0A1Y1NEE4_PHOPY
MNMALEATACNSPPGTKQRSHILMQNPPKAHPNPSVSSLKNIAAAPTAQLDMTTATTYPPCNALLTGTVITYTINTDTPSAVIYAVEKNVWIHLFFIPTSV